MKKDASSILCLIAGWLLVAEWFIDTIIQHDFQDMMGLAFGCYFIGKGLFVRDATNYMRGIKKSD